MRNQNQLRQTEQGLSIVEVLVAMAVLSIGLLGVMLLQVMAIRGARGGRSLNTGILVAESVLDRIELEGRLSWLNLTDNPSGAATALSTLQFVGRDRLDKDLSFTAKGAVPDPQATDPADQQPFYTVNMARVSVSDTALPTGHLSDFTVTVTFPDQSQPSAAGATSPVTRYRTVNLTRRVLHG